MESCDAKTGIGLVVIDEIGKMECFSSLFRQTLIKALDGPTTVLGSIALKGNSFISSIKKRPDTQFINVSEKNRDDLLDDFLEILNSELTTLYSGNH